MTGTIRDSATTLGPRPICSQHRAPGNTNRLKSLFVYRADVGRSVVYTQGGLAHVSLAGPQADRWPRVEVYGAARSLICDGILIWAVQ